MLLRFCLAPVLVFVAGVCVSASAAEPVDLFDAMENGTIEVKFIAKSDRLARLLITNKTADDIEVKLPDAFVGVPIAAQLGGMGGMGGGMGGMGGGMGGMGGGMQGVGGGMGGMGGGMGGMGGMGGGAFSVPAEKVGKFNVPVLCLDHGKKNPSSSAPYEIRKVDSYVNKPEVVELLKAFGRGELDHHSAQAAVWHMNNELTWQQLAAKLTGTVRSISRQPYFSQQNLQLAAAYARESQRRAVSQDQPTTQSDAAANYATSSEEDVAAEAQAE